MMFRVFLTAIVIAALMFSYVTASHACSFFQEESTTQQKFDQATAVIATKMTGHSVNALRPAYQRQKYEFRVLKSLKGAITDSWTVYSGNSSCGFYQSVGSYIVFFLSEDEAKESGTISDMTLYYRVKDEASVHKVLENIEAGNDPYLGVDLNFTSP